MQTVVETRESSRARRKPRDPELRRRDPIGVARPSAVAAREHKEHGESPEIL